MNTATAVQPSSFHPAVERRAQRPENDYFDYLCHEIGTPLTTIIGISQMLTDASCPPQRRDECAQMLRDSSTMLMELIQGKLDLAKIRSGAMALEQVPLDLAKVVREAIHIITLKAEAKGIALQAHIGGLPARLMGDPLRVRQIVLNLLSNALKFTEAGYIDLDVQAEPDTQGHYQVRIAVTDTGIGIEPERLERIFDKFTQANTSIRRRYGGTGLGLSICRRLAQQMHGDIRVESTLGMGSCFTALLRLDAAEPAMVAA